MLKYHGILQCKEWCAVQAEIIQDPASYVEQDPDMAQTLLDQREAVGPSCEGSPLCCVHKLSVGPPVHASRHQLKMPAHLQQILIVSSIIG